MGVNVLERDMLTEEWKEFYTFTECRGKEMITVVVVLQIDLMCHSFLVMHFNCLIFFK